MQWAESRDEAPNVQHAQDSPTVLSDTGPQAPALAGSSYPQPPWIRSQLDLMHFSPTPFPTFLVELRIEPRVLRRLGKHSTTKAQA